MSITKLAEARREAGLKEAEVEGRKVAARNQQSNETMLMDIAARFIDKAPEIVRELVKPAERISEIKVLQMPGFAGSGDGQQALGAALGPVAKTIVEASAMLPLAKELLRFADTDAIRATVAKLAPGLSQP